MLFAPMMWLGNSEHHLDFAGTMSAAPRVYLDLLRDLVENFLFHNFTRIVLINGHGGNIVPSQQAVFELRGQLNKYHLGIHGAAAMRDRLVRAESLADIEAILGPVVESDERPMIMV